MQPIGVAAEAQLQLVTDGVGQFRTATSGHRVEVRLDGSLVSVGGFDGGLQQGYRVLGWMQVPRRGQPVEPLVVIIPLGHLGPCGQGEQEGLVGRPAVDDHDRLGEPAVQSAERFAPVAAPSDDFGDHRVELRGDLVAFCHTGVDPDSGARRQPQRGYPARCGSEAVLRILGVEPCLDRVPVGGRRLPGERLAARDVQLHLDQVKPGGQFRDRVLDLQPGVDLDEHELHGHRVEQELDRAGATIARGGAQPYRGVAQFLVGCRVEQRAAGLLDDLLVAPLDAAVTYPDGPGVAERVRDHLDFDVACRREPALDEDGRVAEAVPRLGLSGREGGSHVVGGCHRPDATATAAR